MCFLNPMDKTVFSKNFQINPNGAAVSAFLGTCMGSVAATLAVLLPYPLGWATDDMKASAKNVSEDTCKLFIQAVHYFRGDGQSLLIDRQLEQMALLKEQVGGLGKNIYDSWTENLDFNNTGTVRKLYEIHHGMLGQIFDILHALQVAMQSEDFAESHKVCMEAIGQAAKELVDETSLLLLDATMASEDGEISSAEVTTLQIGEERVQKAIKNLSSKFDAARRKKDTVSKELMNEAFFVFCLCAFGRLVKEYSTKLHTDPPQGDAVDSTLMKSAMAVLKIDQPFAWRIAVRYWLSLMACFLFAAYIDNYSPSCAITAVFLINTRVGPDVMAMISGLLAVVVGVVANSLMYSFSCKFGDTSVLMCVVTFYWIGTILLAKSGSSLSGIGLLMAALAPFAVMARCVPLTPAQELAKAGGLFGTIRALLIAVIITVVFELLFIPGMFTKLATDSLKQAFEAMAVAFDEVLKEQGKPIDDVLGDLSAKLGDADMYNTAAAMEPRLWRCGWQGDFLSSVSGSLNKARLDINIMKLALDGYGSKEGASVMRHLNTVAEVGEMKKDLSTTIRDGQTLSIGLLEHEFGHFDGIEMLEEIEGLDDLNGYDEAVTKLSKVVKFPSKAPESMEEDELCQLAIVFVMLDYLVKHIAEVTKAAVKLA
eukprot:TRINITY_DN6515_c0_g1_i2.p1 TRINITY_DN6515_c0_g1~~TRINITY_DN6515_c0_g1_i2.p1  ORF type:complete len:653 (+),score=206.56 TRINITY_DN6515_c0_g1_i2:2-1960(+)